MSAPLVDRLELPAGGERFAGRHEVVAGTLLLEGERLPVVVKKVPVDWRQRLAGRTKARRSFETARALLERGIDTPEPLAAETVGGEGWFVARLLPEARQVREWFRHRYEPGFPEPGLPIPFGDVVGGLGRLARRMHDSGVFFRDLTDGNVLVTEEAGRPRLWLVDLNRARVGTRPVGFWNRLRDLSRPGVNALADRRLLVAAYLGPGRPVGPTLVLVTLLRARIRGWDELKRVLRPWRR
ncbi:MAG: hypothetical protein EDX89_20930 [Acidobacteria bacterium]|nr:MAG: hypothetical protein EDX89_20930 [Acidobacteriota bacterium]MCE7959902.1 hypothetical protein [Acidobacteria bacterium ACB2]